MFSPLPTPPEAAHWDKQAIAFGIPEFALMENAAIAALAVLRERYGPLEGKRVLLFMGAGANGGDAAALARHLHDAGARTALVHTRALGQAKGATKQHIGLATRCALPFMPAARWLRASSPEWLAADIVVDGIFGTGFQGSVRSLEQVLIERINTMADKAFVLALDTPSGLDARLGQPSPLAVRAHATVCFGHLKTGLVMPEATPFCGTLHRVDIGLPRHLVVDTPSLCRLMRPGLFQAGGHSPKHKGEAGHVLVIGGSARYTGAAHLAALGALRNGAGLVSVAAPAELLPAIKGVQAEFMGLPLNEWSASSGAEIAALLANTRCTALCLGPGMGQSQDSMAAVRAILALPGRPPAVIDADALAALAPGQQPTALALLRPDDVLTPHPKEAATLLACTSSDIQADRLLAAQQLYALAPAVWVLKGAATVVAQQGEGLCLCPVDAPNLAVGGSGDVLAGALAALCARLNSHMAACTAVMRHALAGLLLAREFPQRGNSAAEIAMAMARLEPDRML